MHSTVLVGYDLTFDDFVFAFDTLRKNTSISIHETRAFRKMDAVDKIANIKNISIMFKNR